MANLFVSNTLKVICKPPDGENMEYNLHTKAFRGQSEVLEKHAEKNKDAPLTLEGEIYHPEAFKAFVQYLYLRNYGLRNGDAGIGQLLSHTRVYAVASKLKCEGLMELVIRKSRNILEKAKNDKKGLIQKLPEAISMVYENTSEAEDDDDRDRLRLILAKAAAANLKILREMDDFQEVCDDNPSFSHDVLSFV
ncbi:hypothetical protein ABW19_dt0200320 [Dactylella cylindrospora]|nr:hypothetical protein ABW19_dt0200320 [Dactylella cylindrospora]